jgi:hypothetical protein
MDQRKLIDQLCMAAAWLLLLVPWAEAQEQPIKLQILAPCKQCRAPDPRML